MRNLSSLLILASISWLAACTPVPDVHSSQEVLWSQYGNQPVDNLLLAWGSPKAETHLTDGSRLITYQHTTTYEAQSPYQRTTGCKVSFIAKAPSYRIDNIALEGDASECQLLSQGRTGDNQITHVATPYVYYPPPYRRYPY